MTKILFASAINHTYPILATNDDGVRADIDVAGSDMDDHVASADIMNVSQGLHVWEGERRERYYQGELDDIEWIKSSVRPATRQDLDELGFAWPAETQAPQDSFLNKWSRVIDQM